MHALSLCFIFFSTLLFGDSYLSLKGYLGYDDLVSVQDALREIQDKEKSTLVIELCSSSGNLEDTFDIARQIYAMKQNTALKVVVFIEDRAIGPAAILPLLADELYVTPVCVWGDMTYNMNAFVSPDVLKMEIMTLVGNHPTLGPLSQAMIDPSINIGGVQQAGGGPLILTTQQMAQLGLVTKILTDDQFHQVYPFLIDHQNLLTPSTLSHEMEEYIRVYPVGVNLVGYLRITDQEPITEKTYLYVKYALQSYVKKAVSCILLHLDTQGGDLLSSLKISTLLQTVDLIHNIPVICFIDKKALASGALLAYSCRFIGASSLAMMGAPQEGESLPDGSLSQNNQMVIDSLSSEMSSVANLYGRNPFIAEAMVNPPIVLIKRNGEVIELQPNENIEPNDELVSDRNLLLTLYGEDLFKFKIAQFVLQPEILPEITSDQLATGRWPAASELAFQQPYLKGIPNAQIISYSSWKIPFYSILTRPEFLSLLVIGLFLGIYIAMHSTGLNLAGFMAATCLAALVFLNVVLHPVGWAELVMVIMGILCLCIEIFLTYSLGVLGVIGIILTLVGLFLMMLPDIGRIDFIHLESVVLFFNVIVYRVVCFLLAFSITVISIIALSTVRPERFRSFRQLFSRKSEELPRGPLPKEGDTGEAYTALGPEGEVLIGQAIYQAKSAKGFIEKGKQVVVMQVKGGVMTVKSCEEL